MRQSFAIEETCRMLSDALEDAMADFFVSYNRADADWAQWIAWEVEEAGYSVVIQAWDFLYGQDFSQRMDRTLQQALRLIAVVSPGWLASKHSSAEWREYYRLDPSAESALILPVVVQPSVVRGLLGGYVRVDLTRAADEVAVALTAEAPASV